MNSNMYSTTEPADPLPVGLEQLAAAIDQLAGQDLHALPDAQAAQRVLELRGLLERLEGHWLRELARVDGRGAAGSETDQPAPSTASWLRNRLRLGKGAALQAVATARALFRGPLAGTAQALAAGQISAAHAVVLANGTADLPVATVAEAEPVLLEAARRLDPPRLRRAVAHLRYVADPDRAELEQQRRYERRGVWLSSGWDGMLGLQGLLDPEAAQTLLAALEPLARPTDAGDARCGWQRNADALVELARRNLEGGHLPKAGGVRPQLLVTVDLATLLGQQGSVGGELGWTGNLGAETCRRLACDSSLTRILVTRNHASNPLGWDGATNDPSGNGHGWDGSSWDGASSDPNHHDNRWDSSEPSSWNGIVEDEIGGLAGRLQAALRLLPPALGGAPTRPLELGRANRVVSSAQRSALVVRDGGCVFPGCDRPQEWCEGHHLRHWLAGGPTDLDNLVLLCRAHHRAVHEGGWRLRRDPDGQMTAIPPPQRQPTTTAI